MKERATLSPRHLRRLASGERSGTTPVTRRVLQRMFGQPVDQLLLPWDQHALIPSTLPGSLKPPGTSERELIAMAARRARQFTLSSAPMVSTESVEQVYDEVRRLATAYPQQSLLELVGDLVDVQ